MNRISSPAALRRKLDRLRQAGKTIGFVPTMGDFHEGHLSLMRYARRENDNVVVSIFVNPKQFGPGEDFKRYPRNLRRDVARTRKERVDILFTPSVGQMYADGFQTAVEVEALSRPLCGAHRPGHFRGVATVAAKLFAMVGACRAYFGLKDYQQAMLVQQMVRDLSFPIKLRFCPLVREADGLACSSRNQYLSEMDRRRALALWGALRQGRKRIHSGVRQSRLVKQRMRRFLTRSVNRIDYVSVVDPNTLDEVRNIRGRVLLAVAAQVGRTRLIDNMLVKV